MSTIEVPYLPISHFKESDVSDKYGDNSPHNTTDLSVTGNKISVYTNEDDLSSEVAFILHGMGMEKYVGIFKEEDIELETFLQLNDSDLQELGIADPKDRNIITENLADYKTMKMESVVKENHSEDFRIARNVFHQLFLIQNYCAYTELQLRKNKLTDYGIGWRESACDYLKAFTECALTQSKILTDSLFNVNKSDHLIGVALETHFFFIYLKMNSQWLRENAEFLFTTLPYSHNVLTPDLNRLLMVMNNLPLPKHLQEKLNSSKKRRKSHILRVMVLIGFCSLVVLTRRSLIRRL